MISDREFLLAEIAELRNGAGIKQENFSESGVPLIKISNFTSNSIDMHGATFVDREHAKKWNHHRLEKDDVLIATVGSWPPNWNSVVGKVVRTPEAAVGGIQNQNTVCVIPNEEIVNKDYLYYKLKSLEFLHWVSNIAQGSANQARVAVQKLGKYSLMLPSLRVQKTIGHILRVLDEKIEINHQTNRTLEQIAQAIFKSWFVDFEPVKAKIAALEAGGSEDDALLAAMQVISGSALFATDAADEDAQTQLARLQTEHPEQYTTLRATAELFPSAMQESELGEIPEGWEETGFSDWVAIKRGRSITRAKVVPGDVPVVAGGLEPAYYHNEYNVIGPVITISASGANAGYVNLYHQNIWSSDSSHISKKSTPYFYTAYVCLKYYQKAIFDMQTGAAQPHVYPKDFERLRIVVGDDKLLKRLESLFSIYFEKSAALKKEIISLAELRDTLLPKLLSGKLSVSAAADQITQAEEAVNVQS